MELWPKLRVVILILTLGGIVGLWGWSNSRSSTLKKPQTYLFPDRPNLSPQWQYLTGESLTGEALTDEPLIGESLTDESLTSESIDLTSELSGYRYQYQHQYQPDRNPSICAESELFSLSECQKLISQNLTISAEVFFLDRGVPVNGMELLQQTLGHSPEELNQESGSQIQLPTGTMIQFVRNDRAYLSTCVNPRGQTTFTTTQHIENRNRNDLELMHILTWAIGFNDLRDWRCLWSNLSIALSTSTGEMTPEEGFLILRDFWQPWYAWWSQNFPDN